MCATLFKEHGQPDLGWSVCAALDKLIRPGPVESVVLPHGQKFSAPIADQKMAWLRAKTLRDLPEAMRADIHFCLPCQRMEAMTMTDNVSPVITPSVKAGQKAGSEKSSMVPFKPQSHLPALDGLQQVPGSISQAASKSGIEGVNPHRLAVRAGNLLPRCVFNFFATFFNPIHGCLLGCRFTSVWFQVRTRQPLLHSPAQRSPPLSLNTKTRLLENPFLSNPFNTRSTLGLRGSAR